MSWNREQIEALAPDSASITAAKKLMSISQWPLREYNPRAVWGHCQGSGKKPYLTRIDLQEPAFKCSCPSRKFPCKHSLALFTLYAENLQDFNSQADCPVWVKEWLDGRDARTQKKASATKNPKPVDKKAQLKRQQKRTDNVEQGIHELSHWQEDILRLGLADLPNKNYAYWNDITARLVDAQASGLVNRIHEISSIALSGKNNMSDLAERLGELHLLLEAYTRLDTLPADLQAEIRQTIGWPVSQQELLSEPGIDDDWLVLGVYQSIEDKLFVQHSWLYGLKTRQPAYILQFAHTTQRSKLNLALHTNVIVQGKLHFYPSATPLRAIIGEHQILVEHTSKVTMQTSISALGNYLDLRQLNPWLQGVAYCVSGVRFSLLENQLWMIDNNQNNLALKVNPRRCDTWRLLALCGGHPINVAIVWNGAEVKPLAVWSNGSWHSVIKNEEVV